MPKWEESMFGHIEKTSNNYINIKEFEIGKVISLSPLEIDNGGLPLYENNLYINPNLLENTRKFKTLTGVVGDSETTIFNGSITFETQLEIGDYVVLREVNQTKYYMICKVTGV